MEFFLHLCALKLVVVVVIEKYPIVSKYRDDKTLYTNIYVYVFNNLTSTLS